MSGSRRDVELVFKATDQSTTTVDKITSSVERYKKSQQDVAAAATAEGKALQQVLTSFKELDSVLRAATGLSDMQKTFNAASDSIKTVTASQAQLRKAVQDSKAAEDSQRLSVQAQAQAEERLSKSIQERTRNLKLASAAQAELNRQAAEASVAVTGAVRSNTIAQNAVVRAQTRLDSAKTPRTIANASGALTQARATASGTEDALAAAQQTRAAAKAAVEANNAQQNALREGLDGDKAALESLRTTLKAATVDLNSMERATKAAQSELSASERTVDGLRKAQQTLSMQLQRGKEAMSGLAAVAANELANSAKTLTEGFRNAKSEMQETEARVNDLQRALNSGTLAQRKFDAEMAKAAPAAEQARTKYQAYSEALRNSARAITGVRMGSVSVGSAQNTVAGAVASVAGYQNAQEAQREAEAQNQLAQARKRAATESSNGFSAQRESLSLYQRVRGQVLSLTAAYVGLTAAIGAVSKIIEVTQTMDSARNALNAVTGDAQKTGQELDWLRRQAETLGVSVGSMAGEYAKMSVGLKLTGVSADDTRKIFMSVANAGRALHLSTADINAAFVAIEQMANKGKVQAEELRQQLGDRLPGAFELFAKAAGVSTSQLDKMMQQGQVGLDLLPKFADTLNETFGSATKASLDQTAANMGRVEDAVFEFLNRISEDKALDGFNELLKTLNSELRSAAADQAAHEIATGLNEMGSAAAFVVEHGDSVLKLLTTLVSIKISSYFASMSREMATAVTAAGGIAPALRAAAGAVLGLSVAEDAAIASTVALKGALRGLALSTVFGAVFAAAGLALEHYMTKVDAGTKTLNEHKKALDDLKNAYDQAQQSGKAFNPESTTGQSAAFWQGRVNTIQQQISTARGAAFSAPTTDREGSREVADLIAQFSKGSIGAEDLRKSLISLQDQIESKGGTMERGLVQNTLDSLDKYQKSSKGLTEELKQAKSALSVFNGEATDADKKNLNMKTSSEESAEATAKQLKATADYTNALKALQGVSVSTKEGEWAKATNALETAYQAAKRYAAGMQDVAAAVNQVDAAHEKAQQDINRRYGMGHVNVNGQDTSLTGTTAQTGAARLLMGFEGFTPTAKRDTDGRFRVGYGSDTITTDSGVSTTQARISVSQADAMRDLYRRIDEVIKSLQNSLGKTTWAGLSSNQQSALTSMVYNYGSPSKINDVLNYVRAGDVQGASNAIRKRGADNGGINQNRRNTEADVFAGSGALDTDAMEKGYAQQAKDDAAALKAQTRLNTEFDAYLRKLRTRNDLNSDLSAADKVRLAVQKDVDDWLSKQTDTAKLSLQQIDALKKADTEYQTRKQNLSSAQESSTSFAVSASALREAHSNYRQAFDQGDLSGLREAQESLDKAKEQMDRNKEAAIDMWKAVGGKESEIAITKINTMAKRADTSASMMKINFEKVGDYLANDMTSSMDSFLTTVGQGGNVVDALKSSFVSFAQSFLIQIAEMILKQQMMNLLLMVMKAISGIGGSLGAGDTGTDVGAAAGSGIGAGGLYHSGGVVGASTGSKIGATFTSAQIMAAPRYHSGGVAGLSSDEQLAVLKKNEEVLTEGNPRHIFNAGKGGSNGGSSGINSIRNVVVLDPTQIPAAMNSQHGETVVLTHIRKNVPAIRQLLGVNK